MSEYEVALTAMEIFYSYSHKDEALRNRLEQHLTSLKLEGKITNWHDRKIGAGTDWRGQIDEHLNSADIILLLVSPDFLASDYSRDIEMQRAMQRHEAGEAQVIPVILRPADWKGTLFGKLQGLPKNARPVTKWPNRDEAFLSIADGIRAVLSARSAGVVTGGKDSAKSKADEVSGVEVVSWQNIQENREEERLWQSLNNCKRDSIVRFISITGKSFLVSTITHRRRDHFEEAINKGVKFQGVLLDPTSNEAVFRSEIESPKKAPESRLLTKDAAAVSEKLRDAPRAWRENLRIGYSQIGLAFKLWLFEDEAYIEPYHFGKEYEDRLKDESPLCGFSHIWVKQPTVEYQLLKDHFDKLWSRCKRYWPDMLVDSDPGPPKNALE